VLSDQVGVGSAIAGYGLWIISATLLFFSVIDDLTNFILVCIGSLIAGFGLFYSRRKSSKGVKQPFKY